MLKRIVITATSCLTPLGMGVDATWQSMVKKNKKSGQINLDPLKKISIKSASLLTRQTDLLLLTINDAWQKRNFDHLSDRERQNIAIYLGKGSANLEMRALRAILEIIQCNGQSDLSQLLQHPEKISPLEAVKPLAATATYLISKNFDIHGPGVPIYCGDVSGLTALNLAVTAIEQGVIDIAIVAASDSILQPNLLPFFQNQIHTSGDNKIKFSEASACLILESQTINKNQDTIANFIRKGTNHIYPADDEFSLTETGFFNNIKQTIEQSNLTTNDIDLLFTFSSGYKPWDDSELQALKNIFAKQDKLLVTTKPYFGFSNSCNGLLDVVIADYALTQQQLFTKQKISTFKHCLVNCASFAGFYSSVILTKGKNHE